MALTFDSTLVGYFAVPTAPPWWASEFQGRMDGEVRRVVAEVMRALQSESRPGSPQDHKSGSNPWAAWPSDHFASTLSAAIALAEANPWAGALGFAYAAALGFTLVYTGEHYVIDLLMGAALALTIHGTGTLLTNRHETGDFVMVDNQAGQPAWPAHRGRAAALGSSGRSSAKPGTG